MNFEEKKNQWTKLFKNSFYNNLNCVNQLSYPNLLDNIWQRGTGFELIFENLLMCKENNFNIIETGTCRSGKWSDGASSILFTEFVKIFNGSVQSVDIKKKSVIEAKKLINSDQFTVHHSDSLKFLKNLKDKDKVDLFYLDSYDVVWDNDHNSAAHHLEEFKLIEPFLKNCLVAIDDNTKFLKSGKRTGKGRLIYEYLIQKNVYPIYDNYIILYRF